jgi:hypothetical protein
MEILLDFQNIEINSRGARESSTRPGEFARALLGDRG